MSRARPWGEPGGGGKNPVLPLHLPDVRRLKTLRAARHLELDLITLAEALEALGLDGAVVDEDVLATVLGDEAETLRVVEPLHSSLCHARNLSSGSSAPVVLPPLGRGCPPLLEDKQKRHATGSRAACISVYNICIPSKRIRFEPERRKLYTKARERSTRFLPVPARHAVRILGRIWPASQTSVACGRERDRLSTRLRRRYTSRQVGSGETIEKFFLFLAPCAGGDVLGIRRKVPKRLSHKSFRLTVARAVLL